MEVWFNVDLTIACSYRRRNRQMKLANLFSHRCFFYNRLCLKGDWMLLTLRIGLLCMNGGSMIPTVSPFTFLLILAFLCLITFNLYSWIRVTRYKRIKFLVNLDWRAACRLRAMLRLLLIFAYWLFFILYIFICLLNNLVIVIFSPLRFYKHIFILSNYRALLFWHSFWILFWLLVIYYFARDRLLIAFLCPVDGLKLIC